jgi:protease-4
MSESMLKQPHANKKWVFGIFLGVVVLVLFICFILVISAFQQVVGGSGNFILNSSNQIALLSIRGPIVSSEPILEKIHAFRYSHLKVLILRLNSPGGAVAPSQEIYSEILKARKKNHKIIIASMSSVAASGAYYIASACNKIVADPGTITASIGVIAEFPDATNLLNKLGIKFVDIKSGKFKDTGNFDRNLTPAERIYLQKTINQVFHQFLNAVIHCRKKDFAQKLAQDFKVPIHEITQQEIKHYVLQFADGRILNGQKAYQLGFVDQLGNFYDAVDLGAKLAGIKGHPILRSENPMRWGHMIESLVPWHYVSSVGNFNLEYRLF